MDTESLINSSPERFALVEIIAQLRLEHIFSTVFVLTILIATVGLPPVSQKIHS